MVFPVETLIVTMFMQIFAIMLQNRFSEHVRPGVHVAPEGKAVLHDTRVQESKIGLADYLIAR